MKDIIRIKAEILGGFTQKPRPVHSDSEIEKFVAEVKQRMQVLPDADVIEFVTVYGGAAFKYEVFIPVTEKLDFLPVNAPLTTVIGWNSSPSILSYIDTYYKKERIAERFFPLFEGGAGDFIYYSLEKDTMGSIYYWHPEAGRAYKVLLSRSFLEFMGALYSHKTLSALAV
ncbi:SMI1/KNR4 family protein [Filimonas effusa]|uniref:Uncharacterized protein n=1 Tax=Filimonas effusa TaxID=2508721 RepID=A0A4Q1D6W9_9BACT|nr:SMI1/KNR4 family protein [Filimonas effusa]RXK83417.1 hypothetical protein ESB13_15080 [Filimonas effusa]